MWMFVVTKLNKSAVRRCKPKKRKVQPKLNRLPSGRGTNQHVTKLNNQYAEKDQWIMFKMSQDAVQIGSRWTKLNLMAKKLREAGIGRMTELNTMAETPPSPAAVTKQLDSATL